MWRDSMGSYCLHLDINVLSYFLHNQMERWKQSLFKMWCIHPEYLTLFHSCRSWTTSSQFYCLIARVSISTDSRIHLIPLHLRSMGNLFWIKFNNGNRLNTLILQMSATCSHTSRLGIDHCMMNRGMCYSIVKWYKLVSRLSKCCW